MGTGGSITLQFNTPIQNNPGNPFGLDFIIFGHAGFIEDFGTGTAVDGSLYTGGTSDARVSVSADGTTFYTLESFTDAAGGWFVSNRRKRQSVSAGESRADGGRFRRPGFKWNSRALCRVRRRRRF